MNAERVVARCRELAAITDAPDGTTLRTFLSPAMRRCYARVAEWLSAAGLHPRLDAAGNLRGESAGRWLIASHLDTVHNAGAFDGILGVVMAIELAEQFPHRIQVVAFSEEEGVRFGTPFIGSLALVGRLQQDVLQRTDSQGISVTQAIRDFGLDPDQIPNAALQNIDGYLEFHIEQGPVLDQTNESIAVVDAIAGQSRALVSFRGEANHAGTTPMHLRRDALAGAVEWLALVERAAHETAGLVATNGKLEVKPGVGNVIAGDAAATLDVRHADDAIRQRACSALRQSALEIAARRHLRCEWNDLLDQPAVPLRSEDLAVAAQAVLGKPVRRMISGAGHDAMIVAPYIPSAMLFLRSPGGISHHPDETVRTEDVAIALEVGKRFIETL